MQVVLVCQQPFRRNSLLKCALQPTIANNSLKSFFGGAGVQGGSRSSMSSGYRMLLGHPAKKPVASACYDKQQVCTYL